MPAASPPTSGRHPSTVGARAGEAPFQNEPDVERRYINAIESLSATAQTVGMPVKLTALSGWSFIAVFATVFVVVTAVIHGLLQFFERLTRAWPLQRHHVSARGHASDKAMTCTPF